MRANVKGVVNGPRGCKVWVVSVLLSLTLFNFLTLTETITAQTRDKGTITGSVVDAETGEPLIGVTVRVEGTDIGAVTDLDGTFRIKGLELSTYSIRLSSVGYKPLSVTEIILSSVEALSLSLMLTPEATEVESITVTGKQVKNSDAAMLSVRQKATSISDAISAEEISRSGSGDAAEAMTKVVGASVVGGKYVYVRGLGDRYANTLLNGSPLPSPEPDKRAVPMDLIPSGLLDNIVVDKTFTADKPGNFAGGSINLKTKDYPEKRTLVLSTSTAYNSITTNKEILTYGGSSKDWLGYDSGMRDIPSMLTDNPDLSDYLSFGGISLVDTTGDGSVAALADTLTEMLGQFEPVMTPKIRTYAPVDQSHAVTYADQFSPLGRPLGLVSSFSYSKKYRSYNDGFSGNYMLGILGSSSTVSTYDPNYELSDRLGAEEVLWGGMMNLKCGITDLDKLGFSFMRSQHAESVSRYLEGEVPLHYKDGERARLWVLSYNERRLTSYQVDGEHAGLFGLTGTSVRASWQLSYGKTAQEEPDRRLYQDLSYYRVDPLTGDSVKVYEMSSTNFPRPQRDWRTLDESTKGASLDLVVPISERRKLKLGSNWTAVERSQVLRAFYYVAAGEYYGDPNQFVDGADVMLIDTMVSTSGDTTYEYSPLTGIYEWNFPLYNYEATTDVWAVYAMYQTPLFGPLNFTGGVRFENTEMFCASKDDSEEPGQFKAGDVLPSLALTLQADSDMNVRLSCGRTIALPTMREMAPFRSRDFGIARIYFGNPDIQRTLIDNYDIRWEWFVRPGEVLAVSVFYKRLKDPIQTAFAGNNGELTPVNVPRAEVKGLEFEVRLGMDHLYSALRNFRFGGNLTLTESKVDIPEVEMETILARIPDAESTRPLAGQSPYLVNLDLAYENATTGTSATILYNVFGKRLEIVARGFTPDIYEEPCHQLDFMCSQVLFGGPKLKLGIKNILQADVSFVHDDIEGVESGEKAVYKSYSKGMSVSVGVSYDVW